MATLVIVGAQWGDEAKGKLVDALCERAAMVVRFGGGSNAGHTVTIGDAVHKFHLVPSSVLRPEVVSVIASGVVIDPKTLMGEIGGLKEHHVSPDNLRISANAHVVLPYHPLLENVDEQLRGESRIGTTNRGIGPAYVDKAARCGIRMAEFVSPQRFRHKLESTLEAKNSFLRQNGVEPLDAQSLLDVYLPLAEELQPYVCATEPLVFDAVERGDRILFEGAQGTLLDLDYGTYPYVTSSHPVAAGACLGTGIGPTAIRSVLGVSKVYSTRVGSGPFPTELHDAAGQKIRDVGKEYGTTTGRPRRCGWLDLVALRYAARVNGLTSLALTRLDVLDGMRSIRACVAYRMKDMETDQFTPDSEELACARPVWREFPGWKAPTTEARLWFDLPENARHYLDFIEEYVRVPISIVSVGPERTQTIYARPNLLWPPSRAEVRS